MEDEEVLEGLNEWQQIQSPWHQITCSTTTTSPTTNTHGNDSSAVVIRDNYLNNDCFVFHPSNHEDLPIPPQDILLLDSTREQSHSSNSLSSSDSSSNEDDDEVGPVRVLGGDGRCWRLNLGLLSSGIVRVALTIRNFAVSRGGFWSFVCVTGVLVVYARLQRWRRRVLQKNVDRLMLLIREKDQKISQLLLKIAQMNEVLSVPRKVTVYRVG